MLPHPCSPGAPALGVPGQQRPRRALSWCPRASRSPVSTAQPPRSVHPLASVVAPVILPCSSEEPAIGDETCSGDPWGPGQSWDSVPGLLSSYSLMQALRAAALDLVGERELECRLSWEGHWWARDQDESPWRLCPTPK